MPNRVLRDWTTSEAIDQLSPGAEVFFTRLIMKADDYGNYTANSKLLNAALFPLRKYPLSKIEAWIIECIACGAVKPYNVDGKAFLNIPNFGQRLRTMTGKYPLPSTVSNPPSIDGQLSDNGRPETKRSRNETEVETKAPVNFDKVFLDAFDEITCERFQMTFQNIPPADLRAELQQFRTKCDNDPQSYHHRDSAGLRTAFQYQLKQYKHGKRTSNIDDDKLAQLIKARHGTKGTA